MKSDTVVITQWDYKYQLCGHSIAIASYESVGLWCSRAGDDDPSLVPLNIQRGSLRSANALTVWLGLCFIVQVPGLHTRHFLRFVPY